MPRIGWQADCSGCLYIACTGVCARSRISVFGFAHTSFRMLVTRASIASCPSRARRRPRGFARLLLLCSALVAACSDAPTEPQIDCSTVALGAPLAVTITEAASLRPALEDARDRILPALGAPPALDVNIGALETAVARADRVAACQAFNTTVTAFDGFAASAPTAAAADLEVLRLTLQFARTWITAR